MVGVKRLHETFRLGHKLKCCTFLTCLNRFESETYQLTPISVETLDLGMFHASGKDSRIHGEDCTNNADVVFDVELFHLFGLSALTKRAYQLIPHLAQIIQSILGLSLR